MPSAFGYELQYASTGDVVRWHESCFKYTLHQDGATDIEFSALQDAIRVSFEAWSDIDCSYFYMEPTEVSTCYTTIDGEEHPGEIGLNQEAGNMNLLVWKNTNWEIDGDHLRDAMALTTLSYNDDGGQILDADIEFNDEVFDFSLTGEANMADLQNTATHEIGHMLGLEHSDVPGATMNYSAMEGDTDKRDLEEDDIDGLCELYPVAEDPQVCKLPFCGLDLACTTTACDSQNCKKNVCATAQEVIPASNGCSAIPASRPQPNRALFHRLTQLVHLVF